MGLHSLHEYKPVFSRSWIELCALGQLILINVWLHNWRKWGTTTHYGDTNLPQNTDKSKFRHIFDQAIQQLSGNNVCFSKVTTNLRCWVTLSGLVSDRKLYLIENRILSFDQELAPKGMHFNKNSISKQFFQNTISQLLNNQTCNKGADLSTSCANTLL